MLFLKNSHIYLYEMIFFFKYVGELHIIALIEEIGA
jgi:hypothetical protein